MYIYVCYIIYSRRRIFSARSVQVRGRDSVWVARHAQRSPNNNNVYGHDVGCGQRRPGQMAGRKGGRPAVYTRTAIPFCARRPNRWSVQTRARCPDENRILPGKSSSAAVTGSATSPSSDFASSPISPLFRPLTIQTKPCGPDRGDGEMRGGRTRQSSRTERITNVARAAAQRQPLSARPGRVKVRFPCSARTRRRTPRP